MSRAALQSAPIAPGGILRKPPGVAGEVARSNVKPGPRTFAKNSRRSRSVSVEYKPDIFGHDLTEKFVDECEAHAVKLVYRGDPRKIIRGVAKRVRSTEEAVSNALIRSRFMEYRAKAHSLRHGMLQAMAAAENAASECRRKARIA